MTDEGEQSIITLLIAHPGPGVLIKLDGTPEYTQVRPPRGRYAFIMEKGIDHFFVQSPAAKSIWSLIDIWLTDVDGAIQNLSDRTTEQNLPVSLGFGCKD